MGTVSFNSRGENIKITIRVGINNIYDGGSESFTAGAKNINLYKWPNIRSLYNPFLQWFFISYD